VTYEDNPYQMISDDEARVMLNVVKKLRNERDCSGVYIRNRPRVCPEHGDKCDGLCIARLIACSCIALGTQILCAEIAPRDAAKVLTEIMQVMDDTELVRTPLKGKSNAGLN